MSQDTTLLVSELVANAVRHGGSNAAAQEQEQVELILCRGIADLACVVIDASPEPPVLRTPDPAGEAGRGLHVVEALASEWGWVSLGDRRKAVWAVLRIRRAPATTAGLRSLPDG